VSSMSASITCSPRHSAKKWPLRSIALAALFCAGLFPGGSTAVRAQTPDDSLYAVLFLGKDDSDVYLNDLRFAFKTLINDYGYTKENVTVLKRGGFFLDLDGDGLDDVDYSATKANLDQVFTDLQAVMTNNDVFFFFATDHGYWSGSDCNDAGLEGYEGEDIPEEDLVSYVDRLDSPTCRIVKILLFVTCGAGGMIPEFKALDTPLMIATASKACEIAHYDDDDCQHAPTSCNYTAYSFWWFSALHGSHPDGTPVDADENNDGSVSIYEAATFARENDEYVDEDADHIEHPLYWDSNCLCGRITTLNGVLPNLPALIAFPCPCHGPWPCRWNTERCPWPREGNAECGIEGSFAASAAAASRREDMWSTVWADPALAPGETTYVWAKVRNDGDTPLTSATVNVYYGDPTLSLVYPQAGLVSIGTVIIPFLRPKVVEVVGPLIFVPPSEGNSFGEPHWTLMAVAEHSLSPVETGWLEDDDHVAATNCFEIAAPPTEPGVMHVALRNPFSVSVKALLTLDQGRLPSGWTVTLSPSVGDTIEIAADSSIPLEVTMTGIPYPTLEGEVDISMSLYTADTKECESCEDSTCGGFIGDAGGCTVVLTLEGVVPVQEPEIPSELTLQQNYPNPFNPTTTIAFSLPEKTRVTLAIYDVHGRLVTRLVDAELDAGFKEYRWDGTDSRRCPVGSGVYFCRLDTGTGTLVEKMVLLR
jgi:hypothetical protein